MDKHTSNARQSRFPFVTAETFFEDRAGLKRRSYVFQAVGGVFFAASLLFALAARLEFGYSWIFMLSTALLGLVVGGYFFLLGVRLRDSISSNYREYLSRQSSAQLRRALEVAEGDAERNATYNYVRRRLNELEGRPSSSGTVHPPFSLFPSGDTCGSSDGDGGGD